jgi:pimeloyl-ACP methyl ester carboxylesterase
VTATAQDTDRFVDLPAGPRLCHRTDGPDGGTPQLLVAGRRHRGRARVGVLDALGIQRVHLLGMSMGGMIAQTVAGTAHHPAPGVVGRLVELTTDLAHSTPGGDPR